MPAYSSSSLTRLLEGYCLAARAEARSPMTIQLATRAVGRFSAWLSASGRYEGGGAVRRSAGQDRDPVEQLPTNFGGGRTRSMLAFHHLFSGVRPRELPTELPLTPAPGKH
jgi:hypothetical protein